MDRGSLTLLLLRAAPAFPDEHFQSLWKNAETRNLSSSEDRLLFPLGKIDSSGN
jgi:hypothetical protein